jgi:RHS repeat-associated protein
LRGGRLAGCRRSGTGRGGREQVGVDAQEPDDRSEWGVERAQAGRDGRFGLVVVQFLGLNAAQRGTLDRSVLGSVTATSAYNAFDQLVSVTTAGSTTTYSYDALERLAQRNGALFAYAGLSNHPIRAPSAGGDARVFRGPDGTPLSDQVGGRGARLLASDRVHGDLVAAFTPDTGALSASKSYAPYGESAGASGDLPLGFQGGWSDPTSGRLNAHARWYEPGSAAFLTRDSVTLDPNPVPQANRYLYADANPTTYSDPTGHCPPCVVVPLAAAVGVEALVGGILLGAGILVAAAIIYDNIRNRPDDYGDDTAGAQAARARAAAAAIAGAQASAYAAAWAARTRWEQHQARSAAIAAAGAAAAAAIDKQMAQLAADTAAYWQGLAKMVAGYRAAREAARAAAAAAHAAAAAALTAHYRDTWAPPALGSTTAVPAPQSAVPLVGGGTAVIGAGEAATAPMADPSHAVNATAAATVATAGAAAVTASPSGPDDQCGQHAAAAASAEEARDLIADIATDVSGMGLPWLEKQIPHGVRDTYDRAGTKGGPRWYRRYQILGHVVHDETAQRLEEWERQHGQRGRFTYTRNKGADFYDSYTGRYIELTTPSSLSGHKAKAKLKTTWADTYKNALYALYCLPKKK